MSNNTEALNALKIELTGDGLEAFLQNIHALVAVLDASGAPLGWNRAFEGIAETFTAGTQPEAFRLAVANVFHAQEPSHAALEIDGIHYECLVIAQPDDRLLFVAEPERMGFAASVQLAGAAHELNRLKAELEETRQALEIKEKELNAVVVQADEVSHTDMLTFLPNRKSMIAELQRQVTYAERYGVPLSVSMIDIDNFKDINDTLGHGAGDQVLRFIASEMRDRIREPDVLGRYGGDEFLVILPNSTASGAAEQATRLNQQVATAPVVAGKQVIKVTMSIGITQYQPNSDTWQTLLERADQAMYQAKHDGRGTWAIIKG